MLSDQERRMLEQLEVSFAEDAVEPDRSGCLPPPACRRMGRRTLAGALRAAGIVAGVLWSGLFLVGAGTAALALGLAGALAWGVWRAWPRLATPGPSACASRGRPRAARGDRVRPYRSTWLRRHLERLVEDE